MEGSFLGSFIVLFRESFEAALIVGIVLSYLARSDKREFFKTAFYGVAAGVGASVLVAVLFDVLSLEFEGPLEMVFEGTTMLVTAFLLATMIVYMMRAKPGVKSIEDKAGSSLLNGSGWGLFALVFFSVFREGFEAVLFMIGLKVSGTTAEVTGGLVGILGGVALIYAVFKGFVQLNFKTLFTVTNGLLILIASGLVAHGVHELQEVGWVPTIIEHLYDINPAVLADGSYPIFHEDGAIGEILSGVFGYNGNPSLLEVITYFAFMVAVIVAGKVEPTRSRKAGEQVAHS